MTLAIMGTRLADCRLFSRPYVAARHGVNLWGRRNCILISSTTLPASCREHDSQTLSWTLRRNWVWL